MRLARRPRLPQAQREVRILEGLIGPPPADARAGSRAWRFQVRVTRPFPGCTLVATVSSDARITIQPLRTATFTFSPGRGHPELNDG